MKDVVFHWTRGNQSVSGLDHLHLAQYTLEDHYTSESEAVYETGMSTHTRTRTRARARTRTRTHTHTHTHTLETLCAVLMFLLSL